MKQFLPYILLVSGLALGIFGFTKLDDSSASMAIGDVEISATDEGSQTQAYVLIGIGVIGVLAGVGLMTKAKS